MGQVVFEGGLFYCGIDLHARCLYLCILNQSGEIVLHKNIKVTPNALLDTNQPLPGEPGNRR